METEGGCLLCVRYYIAQADCGCADKQAMNALGVVHVPDAYAGLCKTLQRATATAKSTQVCTKPGDRHLDVIGAGGKPP